MLGPMYPALLESWVPSSHLPPLPEVDDHYRPGEFLKFLKSDFLDFPWHFPGGGEREGYPRNIEPNLARNGMASTPSSAAGRQMRLETSKAAHLEKKACIVASQILLPGKPTPGNAQRSQSKIRLKLHKTFKQVKLIEASKN